MPPIKQFCPKGHDTLKCGRRGGFCLDCKNEWQRAWNKKPEVIERKRLSHLRRKDLPYRKNALNNNRWKYQGILNADKTRFTALDYDRAYQIQQGKCLLCSKHQTEVKFAFVPDHDHKTGIFRGLFCQFPCNIAIMGNVENYPDLIIKAQKLIKGELR